MRLSIICNELPPYRVPLFQAIDRTPGITLQVLFCTEREPNRLWELPPLDFGHMFLRERIITLNGRYIHNNPGVIPAIHRFSPDVIVTGGFNPTHLYAFAYAQARGIPHVPLTDGTLRSEEGLSKAHRLVRRIVYSRSKAFVSASKGGRDLYESYGVPAASCFISCLCIDNEAFRPALQSGPTEFDFLFCGRFETVKNPIFALDVASAAAKKMGRRTSILFVGAGAQAQELRDAALMRGDHVDVVIRDFTAHSELPAIYHSARLFLFPTLWDPWGVVANEACAAGLPVLVSPEAGSANELVKDGHNGFVSRLDVDQWATNAATLLTQPALWESFSHNSMKAVKDFTYAHAAAGMVTACRHALPEDFHAARASSVKESLRRS